MDDDRTRHEGVDVLGATRYEGGGADPEATRHEAATAVPPRVPSYAQVPAALNRSYEFVRLLSLQGGEADVLLCRRRATGEDVVVKLYRGSPHIEEATYEALSALGPAHVAPILEVNTDDERPWEVQEYFPEGSLEDLIVRRGGGPQPDAFVRRVVAEVAEALACVHGVHVVHRDLKPGNIFVRAVDPLDLVLGDFGLARTVAMSTYMSVVWSPRYAAPEGLVGRGTTAVDWWALGIIVYELLTGHALYLDDRGLLPDSHTIRGMIAEGAYSLDAVTDARWSLLLRGLLNRSHKHRWEETQVRAWLAGESPEVTVVEEPALQTRVVDALETPWGSFREPAALVSAMVAHWDEACEYLSGRSAVRLRLWLESTDAGDRASRLLNAVKDTAITPGEMLVHLQFLFPTGAPVQFAGFPLDGPTLTRMATAAASGDASAQEWVRALRAEEILGAVASRAPGSGALDAASSRLTKHWQVLDARLRQAEFVPALKASVEAVRPRLEGVVLAAALDDRLAARHLKDAERVVQRSSALDPAPLREWSKQVEEQRSVPDAILLTVVGDVAITERLEREEAQREADKKAEQERARREAARRREQFRRELGARTRSAWWRLVVRAVILAGLSALLGWAVFGGAWQDAALALGTPLVVPVLAAFAAEALLPAGNRRVGYALGAGALAWRMMTTFGSIFDADQVVPVLIPGWVIGFTAWFFLGYVVGVVLEGFVLLRGSASRYRPGGWSWVLPTGAIHAALLQALLTSTPSLTETINRGWGQSLADRFGVLPLHDVLGHNLAQSLTFAVGAASLLVLATTHIAGALPRPVNRVLRVVLGLLALIVVAGWLPAGLLYLVASIMVWTIIGVLAMGVAWLANR